MNEYNIINENTKTVAAQCPDCRHEQIIEVQQLPKDGYLKCAEIGCLSIFFLPWNDELLSKLKVRGVTQEERDDILKFDNFMKDIELRNKNKINENEQNEQFEKEIA